MNYRIQLASQLSQHLKSFRQYRKMTQRQLAQSLGLTQSRIAEIEATPGKISVENLLKILSALDIQLVLEDRSKPEVAEVKLTKKGQNTQTPSGIGLLQIIKKNPPSSGSW